LGGEFGGRREGGCAQEDKRRIVVARLDAKRASRDAVKQERQASAVGLSGAVEDFWSGFHDVSNGA
jgi:hypothetical protein